MLFVDLDETLIKSIPAKIPGAPIYFKLDGRPYSTFIRPDASYLKPYPFIVFTAGTCPYAKAICRGLIKNKFKVQAYLCRDHLDYYAEKHPEFTGYLIDNSETIAKEKLNKLPGVNWIKPESFDFVGDELGLHKDGIPFESAIYIAKIRSAIEYYIK